MQRSRALKSSLSLLLNVSNVGASIERLVNELLEVVSEIATEFELVLLDRGSRDETAEIAHELALRFPQVSSVALPVDATPVDALRAGLSRSRGESVMVLDSSCRVQLRELDKLWAAGREHDLVLGQVEMPRSESGESLLRSQGITPLASPTVQLFKRRVTRAWLAAETDETLLAYVVRKNFRVHRLSLRSHLRPVTAAVASIAMGTARIDAPVVAPPPTATSRRHGMTARMKNLLWGD